MGLLFATVNFKTAAITEKSLIQETPLAPTKGVHNLIFTYSNSSLKDPLENAVTFDWFYFTEPFPGADKVGYADMKTNFWHLLNANVPSVPVMMDNPPTCTAPLIFLNVATGWSKEIKWKPMFQNH